MAKDIDWTYEWQCLNDKYKQLQTENERLKDMLVEEQLSTYCAQNDCRAWTAIDRSLAKKSFMMKLGQALKGAAKDGEEIQQPG